MQTKNFLRTATLIALALLPAWHLRADPALPDVPPGLMVPPGLEPALVLTGKGVQIYECRETAGAAGKHEWVFKAPEAELFDAQGHKVGRHYAGPTWELADGGKVVGKLKAKADAPDGKGIPWLLLEAAGKSGPGVLGKTLYVQRISTAGGKTPTESADEAKVGQEWRVDYTATYVFYGSKS